MDSQVGMLGTAQVPDYVPGLNDWSAGAGMFAVCLSSIDPITTIAAWSVSAGGCAANDADPWRAVPREAASGSLVANTSAVGHVSGRIGLRFGLRVALSQAPGTYVAPVAFEVVAPAA
jgi:hypothetical protein